MLRSNKFICCKLEIYLSIDLLMPNFNILRTITYDMILCIILWVHSNFDIYSRRFYAVGNWRSNYLIFNGFFLLPLCYYMWGIVVVVTAVTFIFLSALLFQVVFPNRLHLFIDVFFVSLQGLMARNLSFSYFIYGCLWGSSMK